MLDRLRSELEKHTEISAARDPIHLSADELRTREHNAFESSARYILTQFFSTVKAAGFTAAAGAASFGAWQHVVPNLDQSAWITLPKALMCSTIVVLGTLGALTGFGATIARVTSAIRTFLHKPSANLEEIQAQADDLIQAAKVGHDLTPALQQYLCVLPQLPTRQAILCAHRALDLADQIDDPGILVPVTANIIASMPESIVRSDAMRRGLEKIALEASVWLSEAGEIQQDTLVTSLTRAAIAAYQRGTGPAERYAARLLEIVKELPQEPSDMRFPLLKTANRIISKHSSLRENIEGTAINDALRLAVSERFNRLREIAHWNSLSRDTKISIAHQLETDLPSLRPDRQKIANRLIRHLTPNSYELDRRAREREREQ